jgi:hypothetical protein
MAIDYNAINFKNKDVDKFTGKFGNEPGPIKAAVNTIKVNRELRADEKQRANDMGYKYDRNTVHVGEEKAPMSLKGSVGAAVSSGLREKKKDIAQSVAKVGDKIKDMREAAEYRKASNANQNRAMSNRADTADKGKRKSSWGVDGVLLDMNKGGAKKVSSSNNRKASDNRQIRSQMNRSKRNRIN